MLPEATATPDAPQPTQDIPSPTVDAPTPTGEPAVPPQEAPPVPMESEPVATEPAPPTEPPTAQTTPNEPLAPEPEPIAPEPPSSAAPVPAPTSHIRDLLTRARTATQDRKRKKRDKIMQALNSKNKITNDEVEKLLHVSDATATRYLAQLEKEGKIQQVGKTGQGVMYQKI